MREWNLITEMDQLHRELDGLFGGLSRNRLFGPAFEPGPGLKRYPKLNLREDDENLYVEALLPGVEPKQLELSVLGDTLTMSGVRPALHNDEAGAVWHRRERGAGEFMRSIELPVAIDADRIRAQCRNGLLRVTLPKAAEAKPKKISVKVK